MSSTSMLRGVGVVHVKVKSIRGTAVATSFSQFSPASAWLDDLAFDGLLADDIFGCGLSLG